MGLVVFVFCRMYCPGIEKKGNLSIVSSKEDIFEETDEVT